jgi:hypothetical protein
MCVCTSYDYNILNTLLYFYFYDFAAGILAYNPTY